MTNEQMAASALNLAARILGEAKRYGTVSLILSADRRKV